MKTITGRCFLIGGKTGVKTFKRKQSSHIYGSQSLVSQEQNLTGSAWTHIGPSSVASSTPFQLCFIGLGAYKMIICLFQHKMVIIGQRLSLNCHALWISNFLSVAARMAGHGKHRTGRSDVIPSQCRGLCRHWFSPLVSPSTWTVFSLHSIPLDSQCTSKSR